MKKISQLLILLISACPTMGQFSNDTIALSKIYEEVLLHGTCYDELNHLCKKIGHRLAGSQSAQNAIDWGKTRLLELGADTSYLMPVDVPKWSRGKMEYGKVHLRNGHEIQIPIAALGGSVASTLRGEIVMVNSVQELENIDPKKIKGKIVFINKPLDAALINTGAAYGNGGETRWKGPKLAESKGAIGCLTRSLTLADDQFPHTGATEATNIPAAALSAYHSKWLSDELKLDVNIEFEYHLECSNGGRVQQANVIAEIKGSVYPNEIITIGGHLDSWDIGEGAHDDGTGCVQSMEVIRTLHALDYKPKRTIRVVLFINEEFGNDGGITYAKKTVEQGDRHLAAIESDGGGFSPRGFSTQSPDARYEEWIKWLPLFEPYNLHSFKRGWSGVDIGPLKNDEVALFALTVDNQRYFDYHHTANDVFENVNKRELQLGAASMAALVYLIDQHFSPLP